MQITAHTNFNLSEIEFSLLGLNNVIYKIDDFSLTEEYDIVFEIIGDKVIRTVSVDYLYVIFNTSDESDAYRALFYVEMIGDAFRDVGDEASGTVRGI